MKLFTPTLIAATVTMALGSSAVNALPTTTEVIKVEGNYAAQAFTSFDAASQQALAARPTVSGMKSQFDNALGKATFVWAPQNMRAPDLTNVVPSAQPKAAANHYLNALTGMSVDKGGLSQAVMSSFHDMGKGTRIAKYTQEVSGIEVFNREMNVMLNDEMSLVAASGYFSQNLLPQGQIAPDENFGNPQAAIQFALNNFAEGDVGVSFGDVETKGKYQSFNAQVTSGKIELGTQPRAKKVYFDGNGGLRASYYVEIDVAEKDSVNGVLYGYVIDAVNGKIFHKHRMTSEDSHFNYRAYAHDDLEPMQGPHGKVLPALAPGNDPTEILDAPLVSVATMPFFSQQDPWLEPDATIVSGNNAFAYADVLAPQGFSLGDFTAEVTSDKTFDYVLDPSQRANSLNNRKAAIVNLFYMTNYLHNYYYDYGFDEASGNAQLSNYGRGGVENDPLLLEAQDNSGLNNANMATPADGGSPRMQQFLWTDKDAVVGEDWGVMVTNPADIGVLGSSQVAAFGPQQYSDVAGMVARINDGDDAGGTASLTDGCQSAVNIDELVGKIAIIDRGACAFTTKVLNAQAAGAVGAIIVNNVDDGRPAPMGGQDATVTIASQGLSFQDGKTIYDIIDADDGSVEVELFSTFPLKDSTFDNAIIAHEFGHYIQNRLIGNASGLVNFQGRAMGEGWADIHAMIFVTKEEDLQLPGNEEYGIGYGVGTFVTDFFRGIRRAPYSTDMNINPYTFEHITTGAGPDGFPATSNSSPHGAGEIWAVSLWDFYVSMINTHGFDEAKDRMSRYIVEGYKLTPVAPLYTEARDAILAAAIANDDVDFQLALEAFAKRGMGLGAVSPARDSTDLSGVVPSSLTEFTAYNAVGLNLNTNYDGLTSGFCSADGILDAGETGLLSVTISNGGTEMLSGIQAQVEVVGDADVTLENDGLITFGDLSPFARATLPVEVTINDASVADDLRFVVTFPEAVEGDDIVEPEALSLNATVNFTFTKADPVGGVSTDDMEDNSTLIDWTPNVMVGGDNAALALFDSINTGFFQGRNPGTNLGGRTILFFDASFETDMAWETDAMEVGFEDNFSISFWHAYLFETGFDGGVVELSVNGSPWADVTTFGGVFDFGYNAVLDPAIQDQALAGRNVFTGRNFAPADGGREVINFGSALNGNEVRFRFRIATDATGDDFGWFVDNVSFTNISSPVFSDLTTGETTACDNSSPRVSGISGSTTVNERTATSLSVSAQDRNAGDTITYAWTQTSGTGVQMQGMNGPTLTYTAPAVAANSEISFSVSVSDGTETITQSQTVMVLNTDPVQAPAAPEAPSSGVSSSGGNMGWIALLLAPIAFLRRRRKS